MQIKLCFDEECILQIGIFTPRLILLRFEKTFFLRALTTLYCFRVTNFGSANFIRLNAVDGFSFGLLPLPYLEIGL
jgi:hypothetical protein